MDFFNIFNLKNKREMKAKVLLFLSLITTYYYSFSQNTIELLAPAGTGGPTASGPTVSSQQVHFYKTNATAYSPAISATYSFSNQQFASTEGNPTIPGSTFGSEGRTSKDGDITFNTPTGTAVYQLMSSISGSTDNNYTACKTCTAGTGIGVASNNSIWILNSTDALINSLGQTTYALNSRVRYSDLTITFSSPVNNPVVHITGMGGMYQYTTTINNVVTNYTQGFSTEMDLITPNLSLSKLSGNSVFSVSATQINNTATYLGSATNGSQVSGITRTAATGSVVINGTNISTVTFRLYMRGDGGIIQNGNNTTPINGNNGNIVKWACQLNFHPGGITNQPGLNAFTGDAFMVGLSLQPLAVSGNVFHDTDGGFVNNSSGTINLVPAGITAYLVKNNEVVATSTVNTDGSYSFENVMPGQGYTVVISNESPNGSTLPTAAPPTNWVCTGEFNGAVNTGNDGNINATSVSFDVINSDFTNINFGIQEPPTPVGKDASMVFNPGGTTQSADAKSLFSGTDLANGYVTAIKITTFPAEATSIALNGVVYYTLDEIQAAYPNGIPTDINGQPTVSITVDPTANGITTVPITFLVIDNAGMPSPNTAVANIPFTAGALPVELISFGANVHDNKINLTWKTANEKNFSHFELQKSNDATEFGSIATVNANKSIYYNFADQNPATGSNYYRLKLVDQDGSAKYSKIIAINFEKNESFVTVQNPIVNQEIIVSSNFENPKFILYNSQGQQIELNTISGQHNEYHLKANHLQSGFYILNIITNGKVISKKLVLN
jgi:hypothetical protein